MVEKVEIESHATTSLVIANNDLEASAIIKLVKDEPNIQTVELELGWGDRLDPSNPKLRSNRLGQHVILVECPSPALEQRLKKDGKSVEIIDHHLYFDGLSQKLDRRKAQSSIEQFAAGRKGVNLNDEQRLIGANDRGYWPALLRTADELGLKGQTGIKTCRNIRKLDLVRQKHGDEGTLREAIAWLESEIETREAASRQHGFALLGCGTARLGDPELILIDAPARFKAVMTDAVWLVHLEGGNDIEGAWFGDRKAGATPLEMLIRYRDDKCKTTQIEYSGPARSTALIDQLTDQIAAEGQAPSRLRLWAGGDGNSCYFGADQGQSAPETLDRLLERFLNELLSGNRPLLRWRTQFFQFLRWKQDASPKFSETRGLPLRADPAVPAVRNYIVDFLRESLTPDAQAMKASDTIHADQLTFLSYAFDHDNAKSIKLPTITVSLAADRPLVEHRIDHLRLHFLPERLIAVEWWFQDGWPGAHESDEENAFDQLLNMAGQLCRTKDTNSAFAINTDRNSLPPPNKHQRGIETLAQLLDFNAAARQCYSAYVNVSEHKTISLDLQNRSATTELQHETENQAEQPTKWFGALVDTALEPFGLDRSQVSLVLDERARIMTTAALFGDAPALPAAQSQALPLKARLATVEAYHPQHFYDRQFAEAELDRAHYKRFASSGEYPGSMTLFAVTDHSFTLYGHGNFARNIAIDIMADEYRILFLTGLFYTTALHSLNGELAGLSKQRARIRSNLRQAQREIDAGYKNYGWASAARDRRHDCWKELDACSVEIAAVHNRFVDFANSLWFDEIATQIQGRELFDKIRSQLPIERYYSELQAEIQRTNEVVAQIAAEQAAHRQEEFGLIAGLVSALIAIISLGQFSAIFAFSPTLTILAALVLVILTPVLFVSITSLKKPHEALIDLVWLVRVAGKVIRKTANAIVSLLKRLL